LSIRVSIARCWLAAAVAVAFVAARPAGADSVVTFWDEQALQSVRDTKPGPTLVARMMAIVHTCCFDAWAAYDGQSVGTRLGGSLRRPPVERTEANKAKAISFAAFRAIVDLFPQPAQVAQAAAAMQSLGYDPTDTSTDPATPSGIGNLAAAAVLAFRHADGSNQLGDLNPGAYSDYTGYVAVNTPDAVADPNRWQPLRVSNGAGGTVVQKYLTPHWGMVTPFALTDPAELRPPPPPLFGTRKYRDQAKRALRQSATLTDREKMIAEYWADGPASEFPPGHWCKLAQVVSHRDGMSLDQDVQLFFILANAELDASIGCWATKRFYDYVRPITAVRFLFAGQIVRAWGGPGLGTQLIDAAQFLPYGQAATVVTPNFPEYTSGHSTFSAAGAEILKRFTGSDRFGYVVRIPARSSVIEPGITPRREIVFRYQTFSQAAAQAGMSRIYGSIHFTEANLNGQRMGREIGRRVWEKAQTYIKGTAN